MEKIKKIGTGVFILLATTTVPVVPQDLTWQYSYEVPCSVFSNPLEKTRIIQSTGKPQYFPEVCNDLTKTAYVSVFTDKKDNIVYVEGTETEYRKLGEIDGSKYNPQKKEYVPFFETLISTAEAAIAYDAVTDQKMGNTGTSWTFSHTTGSGSNRLFTAAVNIFSGSDLVSGVTYNGSSATRIDKKLFGDSGEYLYLYYLLSPSTGTNNVVITTSSSATVQAGITTYTGVAQSGQPDASNTAIETTNVGSITGSVTTVADNTWIIAAVGNNGGYGCSNTATNGTRRMGRTDAGVGGQICLFDTNAAQTPAGSKSMTINSGSGSTQQWALVLASFAPALDVAPTPIQDLVKSFWW